MFSPALSSCLTRHDSLYSCRFYKIRVTGAESQPIHAAVPARCLQPGEKLNAVMTASGEIAGISYDLSGVGTSFEFFFGSNTRLPAIL